MIRLSSLRRTRFEQAAIWENMPCLELDIDVKTRWNSTFKMIEKALKMRKVKSLIFFYVSSFITVAIIFRYSHDLLLTQPKMLI